MRVTLLECDDDSPDFPPREAEKMKAWLSKYIQLCPIQFRDELRVVFSVEPVLYDETGIVGVHIYYDNGLKPPGSKAAAVASFVANQPRPAAIEGNMQL